MLLFPKIVVVVLVVGALLLTALALVALLSLFVKDRKSKSIW